MSSDSRRSKKALPDAAEPSTRLCARDGGGGWTCKNVAAPGHRLCQKHVEERTRKIKKRLEKLKAMRASGKATASASGMTSSASNSSKQSAKLATLQKQNRATNQQADGTVEQHQTIKHVQMSVKQLCVFANNIHDWAAHQPSEVAEPVMKYVSTLFAHTKPCMARCNQRVYGEQHVGSRCAVYWKTDDTSYPGKLVDYNALSGHHKIMYDDGSMFWELLGTNSVVDNQVTMPNEESSDASRRGGSSLTPPQLDLNIHHDNG